MKKLLLGLTGVIMLFVLTGCNKYVNLAEYKGVEATKVNFEVSDEEVKESIEERLYDYATYNTITDRGVTIGDYVILDYTAKMGSAVADEYSGEEEEILVGEGYLYPEVEDALVGMKTGESKTVAVKLNEEFAEEGDVGKELSVDIKVGEISEEILPEYNEAYVKENTEFDSMKDYEASIREELLKGKEEEYLYVTADEVISYLVEHSEFKEYPEEMYKMQEELYNSGNEYNAAMFGMEIEEYLELCGIDEETKKKDIEEMVRYQLVVNAVAEKEKLTCTEEEINKYVDEIYEMYGYESTEDFFKDYSKQEIEDQILYEKVADFLYKNAKYREVSEEEYLAEQEAAYSEEMPLEGLEEMESDDADTSEEE